MIPDGKKYLDFAAGIAVCAFGYGKKEYNDALKNQVDKLLHTSNLYYNVPTMEAAEKALAAADMDRIFFTNSGTEAIEGALKAAKNMRPGQLPRPPGSNTKPPRTWRQPPQFDCHGPLRNLQTAGPPYR